MSYETTTKKSSENSRTLTFNTAREVLLARARKNNDGENLSEQLLVERQKIIDSLSRVIDAWITEHVPNGTEFSQDALGKIVQYLGETQKTHIDALLSATDNLEHYSTRPNIKIYEGALGVLPDIWLLGWREHPEILEATDIHDHAQSEAAFHVYRGCVDEIIYTFDTESWKAGEETLDFKKTVRGLRRGSTATIPAPYVHIVSDHRDEQSAVTVHGYYPPLREMNFYKEQDGCLIKTGSWLETDTEPNCSSCLDQ